MASRKPPSTADQQLIEHAARHGYTITVKQLIVWRRAGLLPGNIPGGGLGRGRGSTSTPPPESFDLVVGLAPLAGRGKRPADLALLLFAEGLPVPETTVRAAFRGTVDTSPIAGEEDPGSGVVDLDERLNKLSNTLADSSRRLVLVPARVRRIDERIARVLGDLPPEVAGLDRNADPPRFTPHDATLTAATATLGGSIPLQDIGALIRAMNPGTPAHPFASLVETTHEDALEFADTILADDNSLTILPNFDARDLLTELADTAPLNDLAAGWHAAHETRHWALDLCQRVEAELDADRLGEATTQWVLGRQLLSGISVIDAVRDRVPSPTKTAFSALMLLFQRQALVMLDNLLPGCQWNLLEAPGVMPPPIRDLILSKVGNAGGTGKPSGQSGPGTVQDRVTSP
jgi:hypothetical protein